MTLKGTYSVSRVLTACSWLNTEMVLYERILQFNKWQKKTAGNNYLWDAKQLHSALGKIKRHVQSFQPDVLGDHRWHSSEAILVEVAVVAVQHCS